jgi:hypothetical protein
VSEATDVPVENVLLFLDDGRELKQDLMQAMSGEPGQVGLQLTSLTQPSTLFLFNRQTFWSDAEEWAAQFQEEIQLPPPLNRESTVDPANVSHGDFRPRSSPTTLPHSI